VVVGVVGVVVAAVVVVYIYPLFSGPAAPYLFYFIKMFIYLFIFWSENHNEVSSTTTTDVS
jgi:hypothetical protein